MSRDIPANVVSVGNPARVICSLDEYFAKNKKLTEVRPCYDEEYTLRGNIILEMKQKMFDNLKDGFGFVK